MADLQFNLNMDADGTLSTIAAARMALYQRAAATGNPPTCVAYDTMHELRQAALSELRATDAVRVFDIDVDARRHGSSYAVMWPDGALLLHPSAGGYLARGSIIVGPNETRPSTTAVLALLKKHAVRARRRALPVIGMLSHASGRFNVHWRPVPWKPLVPDNYSKAAVEGFAQLRKFVSKPAKSTDANLAIVSGEPGTGKTHMLRSLVRMTRANFIVVGTHLIHHFDDPSFLPFLLDLADGEYAPPGRTNCPTVLIVEDADAVLSVRHDDNADALSNLLNATSGMVGDAVQLRILATINTWDTERLDPAAIRAGRLYTRVSVDRLTQDEARDVVDRLGGWVDKVQGPLTLAECYALASKSTGQAKRGAVLQLNPDPLRTL